MERRQMRKRVRLRSWRIPAPEKEDGMNENKPGKEYDIYFFGNAPAAASLFSRLLMTCGEMNLIGCACGRVILQKSDYSRFLLIYLPIYVS